MENTYKITPNEAFKSLEIAFDGKPSEAVRDALKNLKFRWHGVKKIWYGYTDEETVKTAIENALKGIKTAPKTKKAEKVNKYGIEVGDVFYLNWGYDQTNVDFFQVVELCGETSVRVKNVRPQIVKTDGEGFMCAHYTYNITKELMTPETRSVFIDDCENGDIKRIQMIGDTAYIKVGHHHANKIPFGLRKEYVSWYA